MIEDGHHLFLGKTINIGQDPEPFQNHDIVDENLVPVDKPFRLPVLSMVVINVVSNQDIRIDCYHDLPLLLYRSPAAFPATFFIFSTEAVLRGLTTGGGKSLECFSRITSIMPLPRSIILTWSPFES
jgi:hypothetical protein